MSACSDWQVQRGEARQEYRRRSAVVQREQSRPCIWKKNKWLIVGAVLILLAAVAYWLWRRYRKKEDEAEPVPPAIGFDAAKLVGKRGKLHVEGKGYLYLKERPGSNAVRRPLDFNEDRASAVDWVWETARQDGVNLEGKYRLEEADTRSVDGNTAYYLSLTDKRTAESLKKSTQDTAAWETLEVEAEAPGSRRFRIVRHPNVTSDSFITSADTLDFVPESST